MMLRNKFRQYWLWRKLEEKKVLRTVKNFLRLYVLLDNIVQHTKYQVKAGEHWPQRTGFAVHLQTISSKQQKK